MPSNNSIFDSMRTLLIPLILLTGLATGQGAVSVFWESNPARLLTSAGTPLSNGVLGVAGDGMLVEAGYYSSSSAITPFGGEWIGLATCSIGDFVTYSSSGGASYRPEMGAGFFSLALITDRTIPTGILLAFRFYDTQVSSEASHFNAVSSANWRWTGDVSGKASLDDTSEKIWLGGHTSAFKTTIAVPESSGMMLALAGCLLILSRRRIAR